MFVDNVSDTDSWEGNMSDVEPDNNDRQSQTSLHTTTAQGCLNSVVPIK